MSPLRWGRVFLALRIIRAVRAVRATMRLSEYFFENKFKSGFAVIATMMFSSMAICGALILSFERKAEGANILDASDALWWCVNTITTVGASGLNPVTQGGRLVGIFLMFVGRSSGFHRQIGNHVAVLKRQGFFPRRQKPSGYLIRP